jgi:drug/metabolite transporter (DMT)-like permease
MISRGVGYMMIATVFLAGMHVLVKALPGIPISQIILMRACVSLLLCSAVLSYNKVSFRGKNIPLLTMRGIVGTASLMTFYYTLHHMPLASAVTIGHLSPLFLGLLAVFFLKEKMTSIQWVSFLVSFSGVFLIKGFDFRITSFELMLAVLSAFLAALAHFTVRMLKDENPLVILFYFSLIVIPILAPYSFYHWAAPNSYQWGILISVGVVSHVAQYFLTKAFKEEEASKVAGVYYLGIVIAIALGYFLYDETFSLESYLGMFLIVSGVIVTVFHKKFAIRP